MVKKKTTSDVSSKKDKPKSLRSAGILLHITSLPSAFAIGDLGPESKKFVAFLSRSNQRYWQLLPLNPPVANKDIRLIAQSPAWPVMCCWLVQNKWFLMAC
jgi:4-alpha-glucanotransferase